MPQHFSWIDLLDLMSQLYIVYDYLSIGFRKFAFLFLRIFTALIAAVGRGGYPPRVCRDKIPVQFMQILHIYDKS
jgi:hypothetical protein